MNILSKSVILLFVFVFLSLAIVESAGVTLKGNTLTYADSGTLNKAKNITLQNDSLFIIDAENGFLKAYFNVPEGALNIPSIVELDFPGTFFSNTSTGFLGDVDNFDSKNGFSRFRETNLNNGTNASAGFLGVNNIGRTISIGIGSSNFEFLNLSLPNLGALRLNSPSPMVFANDFLNAWLWVTDLNNGTNFSAPFVSMDLGPTGNLNISGNLTINNSVTFPHTDSATTQADSVRMFCKPNDKCYIQLSNGQERRLLDGGGGSILIDDILHFIVSQVFEAGINVTNQSDIISDGDITVDTVIDNTIFAQLSSSVDQIPVSTTPTIITYNTQDAISGINHSTSVNPGELTITTGGIYFISPQPQVGKDMGGVKVDFDMFLQVNRNGTFLNEPNSNIKLTIKDFDITDVIVSAFTVELEAGEKIRMMQRASNSGVGMGLKNTNATADVPRTPSIIFTMYRVGG